VQVLAQKLDADIPALKFNTSVAAMMEAYNSYKDKPMCRECLEDLAMIIAPFLPHIAEEFWEALGHSDSIHSQEWPEVDVTLLKQDKVQLPVQINGKVRVRVELSADATEDAVREAVMSLDAVKLHTEGKDIKKFLYVPGKIVTIAV
jgi:leucyl-tRNA synthetase